MKAARPATQAGNRKPAPRQAIADIDVQELKDKMHGYVGDIGIKEAFNMYAYTNLELSKAACGHSLVKKRKLIWVLLRVAPLGAIKYLQLKEACQHLKDSFGDEVFSTFKHISPNAVSGKVADQLFVLLNHVRRVVGCETRWKETFGSWLQGDELEEFCFMKETMMNSGFQVKAVSSSSVIANTHVSTPRKLRYNLSEISNSVSVDSEGFAKVPQRIPKLLNSPDDDELSSIMRSSPPPLRSALKKPAGALSMVVAKKHDATSMKVMKKPSCTHAATGDFKIAKATMKVAGGKYQSYIQHTPNGGSQKQLVVAVSDKMVDGKSKGHREVADALMAWAVKQPKPTKMQVVKQREVLLRSL